MVLHQIRGSVILPLKFPEKMVQTDMIKYSKASALTLRNTVYRKGERAYG